MRWDQVLTRLWPDLSRSRIHELIELGLVEFQDTGGVWRTLVKPGARYHGPFPGPETVRILNPLHVQYVSRGALKLKAAIDQFQIPVKDCVCLDVGLSTGGFSDFLLQAGAAKVLGVDVGQNQLHESLKSQARLVWRDKVNAREPLPAELLGQFFAHERPQFDIIVVDVSFISLALVIPNLVKYLRPGGWLVLLVKPQFELTRSALNKRGVVKDPADNRASLDKIIQVCQDLNLDIIGSCASPIEGENGNQEHLLVACPQP